MTTYNYDDAGRLTSVVVATNTGTIGAYYPSVATCIGQAAVDAGLDLTSLSVLPGANQDNWQWSSDKMGFVYTGAAAGESALGPSTAVDAVERTADWAAGPPLRFL